MMEQQIKSRTYGCVNWTNIQRETKVDTLTHTEQFAQNLTKGLEFKLNVEEGFSTNNRDQ